MFSSNHTTHLVSFMVVLHSNTKQKEPSHFPLVAHACLATVGKMSAPTPMKHRQQVSSQSFLAPATNGLSWNIFKAFTILFQ
jgi:hypothetical protein